MTGELTGFDTVHSIGKKCRSSRSSRQNVEVGLRQLAGMAERSRHDFEDGLHLQSVPKSWIERHKCKPLLSPVLMTSQFFRFLKRLFFATLTLFSACAQSRGIDDCPFTLRRADCGLFLCPSADVYHRMPELWDVSQLPRSLRSTNVRAASVD